MSTEAYDQYVAKLRDLRKAEDRARAKVRRATTMAEKMKAMQDVQRIVRSIDNAVRMD